MIPNVPDDPGVYLFKDSSGKIIYIGKAKILKKRVLSYFSGKKNAKTQALVHKINDIEFIVVNNETEALLLENQLIKKHWPKYNISLKDSKTYAYIKITNEKFPRVMISRNAKGDGTYFGPYIDSRLRDDTIELLVKSLRLRTCKKLPKKACLNYYIGICTAPCIKLVSHEQYLDQVRHAIEFLSGDTAPLRNKLNEELKASSQSMKYELALEKRRQIEIIDRVSGKRKINIAKKVDQDVIAGIQDGERFIFEVFYIKRGVISGKNEYMITPHFEESENEVFENFIKTYYFSNEIPDEIIVNRKFWDDETLQSYFEKLSGRSIRLLPPETKENMALVAIAEKNAALKIGNKALNELQEKMNLPSLPRIIECFDISNLGYDYIVASMVRFTEDAKDKQGYRKFKIKTFSGKSDDFAAMKEVVHRRYRRLRDQNDSMPDLIIIDGGPGQLNSALGALKDLGLKIPIISLAKKDEEIFMPESGMPMRFPKNSSMMLLVRSIRDEAHRFAVSYNRKKRSMRFAENAK
ncbi:MAG: excinuclease ABC subunit UvrC [Candidatus Aenigmarchaeota archaeon]|nr:excinuclease ABC subunit UvrC [Candidatus Aenigmarchaeota archaeon]